MDTLVSATSPPHVRNVALCPKVGNRGTEEGREGCFRPKSCHQRGTALLYKQSLPWTLGAGVGSPARWCSGKNFPASAGDERDTGSI